MSHRLRPVFALALVAALGGASACSGGGGDSTRPSPAAIAQALSSGAELVDEEQLPQEMADCWGQVLYASDLSDAALRALVAGDEDYDASDEDSEVIAAAFTAGMEECGTPAAS